MEGRFKANATLIMQRVMSTTRTTLPLAHSWAATTDPRRQISLFVDFCMRFYERDTDVLETIRAASMAEKDLGALWHEGEHRRRLAQRGFVKTWTRNRQLGPGLDAARAADILWALAGAGSFLLFVHERRWSEARYSKWLAEVLAEQLLREA